MNIAEYWQYTDLITKALFFILIGLSIASWITGIVRVYASLKLQKVVNPLLQKIITTKQDKLNSASPEQRKQVTEQLLLESIAKIRHSSESGMSILGTTAAIAPFIGLFGTVWGIFHALHSIGKSGQAGLDQVAGPVGEALIMTGLGLAVAIPAVVFYNVISRINRYALREAHGTAHKLLAESLLSGITDK